MIINRARAGSRARLLLPVPALLAIMALMAGPRLLAQDVNVSITDASSMVIKTFDLNPVADGSVVRVGTFTDGLGANRTLLETSNDFNTLDLIFTPLAEGIADAGARLQNPSVPPVNPSAALSINSGDIGAAAGSIFMTVTGYSSAYLAPGTQLYVWAFRTNDLGAMQPGEWGIFTSTLPSWLLPNDDPDSTTFLLGNQIDVFLRGAPIFGGVALAPEPASAFLVLTAALLLGNRRRRAPL